MIRKRRLLKYILLCLLILVVYTWYIMLDVDLANHRTERGFPAIYWDPDSSNVVRHPSNNLSTFIPGEVGPLRRVKMINCRAIIEGNAAEIAKAKEVMQRYPRKVLKDTDLVVRTMECSRYKNDIGITNYPISSEEKSFPIAYSILLYKDVEQAERLLRAIYRPQNVYCLHVDAKAPREVHQGIDTIAACFDNVFVVSKKESVLYASIHRLQADLNCMTDLLEIDRWEYFINLPSQEYPLKTNAEIVRILKIYNGANDIEGITGPRMLQHRFKFRYLHVNDSHGHPRIARTNKRKDKPPHSITVVKGSAYGVFSRGFVEFIIHNDKAKDFLHWCQDVLSPDEYYWATLHHNAHLGAPGGYNGVPDTKPWLAAYAAWGPRDPCDGKFVRGICIFGLGDLKRLVTRKELFANKFHLDYEPIAMDCLEEWLLNKTQSPMKLDTTYYQQLPFVQK